MLLLPEPGRPKAWILVTAHAPVSSTHISFSHALSSKPQKTAILQVLWGFEIFQNLS